MGDELSFILPTLPDVIGTIQLVGSKHWRIRWCKAPSPVFPDLDSLSGSEGWARFKYYAVALACSFALHSVVGVLLTIVRNRVTPDTPLKNEGGSYEAVGGQKSVDDLPKRLLRDRRFVGVVLASWFAFYILALQYLLAQGAISKKQGVAWEAWLIWLNVHCLSGLLEVMFSMLQPGKRPLGTYPTKMAMTLLPFLSEKFDAVKDVVFIGIVFHEDEVALGYICLSVLCASQAFFVWYPTTRGEIVESYLPCLVASAVQQENIEEENVVSPDQK